MKAAARRYSAHGLSSEIDEIIFVLSGVTGRRSSMSASRRRTRGDDELVGQSTDALHLSWPNGYRQLAMKTESWFAHVLEAGVQ
jgi:hypothetical protein